MQSLTLFLISPLTSPHLITSPHSPCHPLTHSFTQSLTLPLAHRLDGTDLLHLVRGKECVRAWLFGHTHHRWLHVCRPYSPIYLSIYPSISRLIDLSSLYLSVVSLSIYLSIYLSLYLSIYYLSICVPGRSLGRSVCLSVCPSGCLSVCPSVRLTVSRMSAFLVASVCLVCHYT